MGGRHGTLDERIAWKTRTTASGCVEWLGAYSPDGWVRIAREDGVKIHLHRYLWEKAHGPIGGMRLERTCGNMRCLAHFKLSPLLAANTSASAKHHADFDEVARTSACARFMATVSKDSPRGCWIWTGGMTAADGYGRFFLLGRTMSAHRASYILFKGGISDPMLHVMHSCDDRKCVNPDHLSLGTHQANMEDKRLKGRAARGVGNAQAFITEAEVLALRAEYVEGRYGEAARLADKYRLTITHVLRIVRGEAWAHLAAQMPLGVNPTNDPPRIRPVGNAHHNSKVTDEAVREMRAAHASGEPIRSLAGRFGLSYRTAWGIVTGRERKHATPF